MKIDDYWGVKHPTPSKESLTKLLKVVATNLFSSYGPFPNVKNHYNVYHDGEILAGGQEDDNEIWRFVHIKMLHPHTIIITLRVSDRPFEISPYKNREFKRILNDTKPIAQKSIPIREINFHTFGGKTYFHNYVVKTIDKLFEEMSG